MDSDATLAHRGDRGRGELRHPHPPLLHHEGLVHGLAAVVHADRVRKRFFLHEQAAVLQHLDRHAPSDVTVGSSQRSRRGCHEAARVDDRDHRQTVALSDVEVGGVVARSDLERAGAELRINGIVGDELDAALDHRHEDIASDERLPAFVVGMHRDGHVGHDRLRARGRDDERRIAGLGVGPRIAHEVERVGPLDVLELEVRIRRLAAHAPVHDPIGAVEVTALEQPDEVRSHGALLRRLHREVAPRPVQRAPEETQLLLDARPVVVHPLPHLGEELLASEVVAADLVLRELVLHHLLRDDPGVVGARHIQRRLAEHAVPARHEVLVSAEAERVPEVEVAGDVRQRQHHHERLVRVALVGREEARALPPAVEVLLDGGRTVVLLAERHDRLRWIQLLFRHRHLRDLLLKSKAPSRLRTKRGLVVPLQFPSSHVIDLLDPRSAAQSADNGCLRSDSRATSRPCSPRRASSR